MADETTTLLGSMASRAVSRLRAPATAVATVLVLGLSLSALSRIASPMSPRFSSSNDGFESSNLFATDGSWLGRVHPHTPDCESKSFAETTLILLAEYRAARLVQGHPLASDLRVFGLSDVVGVPNPDAADPLDRYPFYVVLDNTFSILKVAGRVDDSPGTPNDLLPWPSDLGRRPDFEAIAYSPRSNMFALVQEDIVGNETGRLHAHVYEITINSTRNEILVLAYCDSDFTFKYKNKGFEGAVFVVGFDDVEYLLALCEGNHCAGGEMGRAAGHGRLALLKRGTNAAGRCAYNLVTEIDLPPSVKFLDYSAVTIYRGPDEVAEDGSMTVAVASQESAALWVSTIKPVPAEHGYFKLGEGTTFNFPVNDDCAVVYCKIEGVAFLDRRTIIAVSDQMKRGGKQDFRCYRRAESVHLFAFP